MKKLFILLFLLPFKAFSQPFIDIISANYQFNPADETISSSKIPLTATIVGAALNIPFKIDSDYIALNPSYENQSLQYDSRENISSLNSFALPISWLHQWKNQKWKTAFVFISRINTYQLSEINKNAIQFGGAVVNTYKRKENVKYKFGLYYNSEFFGPFFMPLLGIDWNVNSRLNIFGVLPGSMTVEYKILPHRFHAGINFRSVTSSYRVNTNSFLKINDNQLKLFFDCYFTKNMVLSLEAGHTIFRKYKSGIKFDGENKTENLNVSESYLCKVTFAYRIRSDK